MTDGQDLGWEWSFAARCDFLLPKVTEAAVSKALKGFALELVPGKDLAWLAMAVRRALACSVRPGSRYAPERTSNVDIRAELERLAKTASSSYDRLVKRTSATDARLWDFAFRNWSGENVLTASDDPSFYYNRFQRVLEELGWLSEFLKGAANITETQSPNWRRTADRGLRIDRGYFLVPIFEAAFGRSITVNNWPSDKRHRCRTPFMEFYTRMVGVAFGKKSTEDMAKILKDARQKHRNEPAHLAELIPGL